MKEGNESYKTEIIRTSEVVEWFNSNMNYRQKLSIVTRPVLIWQSTSIIAINAKSMHPPCYHHTQATYSPEKCPLQGEYLCTGVLLISFACANFYLYAVQSIESVLA